MTDSWTHDPQVQADPALEAFLRDLCVHVDDSVDPGLRTATLEAMLATAAETTAAPTASPSWGRRARRVLGLTGVKLALAAGVAAATTTGGLAATGSLPAPLQEFAHDVGRQLGVGVPDAPGQQKKSDGDPDTTGRDYAPGQQKKSDGEPGTTGRDHAPGRQRSDDAPGDSGDARDQQDAPAVDDEPAADDEVRRGERMRRGDEGASNRIRPHRAPPADAVPEDLGQPDEDQERPDRSGEGAAEPSPPPGQTPPAGAATQSSSSVPAQQPGRPDAPAGDQRPDTGQDASAGNGGGIDRGR